MSLIVEFVLLFGKASGDVNMAAKIIGKIDAESCKVNISSRLDALNRALINPEGVSKELVAGISSQSSFANLSLPELGIYPIARNTMYKYADIVIVDSKVPEGKYIGLSGRYYLDWLRVNLKLSIFKTVSYRSKFEKDRRLKGKENDLKNKINETEKNSLIVSKAYLGLLRSVLALARSEKIEPLMRDRLLGIVNDNDAVYGEVFREIGTWRDGIVEVIKS